MKCFACGYEKKHNGKWYKEAILYKSGKNKGKVKEIRETFFDPDEYSPEFIKLRIQVELETFVDSQDRYGTTRNVDLYVCPECGTVRIES